MSVFQTIKQSVHDSLKSLTSSRESSSSHGLPRLSLYSITDAGADQLNKYEVDWKELYDAAENNARKAEAVDVQVGSLCINYDRQAEMMGKLHAELANLPCLLSQLQQITDDLATLEDDYQRVEASLVDLANVCAEQDLHASCHMHQLKLQIYKQKKTQDLDKIKVQLAKDHSKKMQMFEQKKTVQLRDRQEAFEDAFVQDVSYYKEHGRLDRLPSTSESEKLDLGEITVEEDAEALEDFLDSSEGTLVSEKLSNSSTWKTYTTQMSLEDEGHGLEYDEDVGGELGHTPVTISPIHTHTQLTEESDVTERDAEQESIQCSF